MFDRPIKVLAHKSVLKKGQFTTPEYIISDDGLMSRFCPHRMYPLQDVATFTKDQIVCKFHGFAWNKDGTPINNDRNIRCGNISEGNSGLLFKNFTEPKSTWVADLANETDLEYSHSFQGSSNGSWLWVMDIQADLLHIRNGTDVVHPGLADVTDLDSVEMTSGDDWILQTSRSGWWLFLYPFTFIEWSPGCLCINYTIPNDIDEEFGFSWITQFYYGPGICTEKRAEFETLEEFFKEDIAVIESQKGKYFPLTTSQNRLEDHCVHFGKWFRKNLRKNLK